MRFFLLTAFPEIFHGPFSESIIRRAVKRGIVEINYIYLRSFADDRHGTIDDVEFGGSSGMVYKAEPIFKACETVRRQFALEKTRIVMPSARGRQFRQETAAEFALESDLIFICGHYKDIDYRVVEHLVTDEISLGDFVITGGELATAVMMDAIIRLLPQVVGNRDSVESDSFQNGLLDCPRYTRPVEYRGWMAPEVLLSGHHQAIREWRRQKSMELTQCQRPDLWEAWQQKNVNNQEA